MLLKRFHWSRQRASGGPSSTYSAADRGHSDVDYSRPLGHGVSLAVMSQVMIRACVVTLLYWGSPATVILGVGTVRVLPVQGHALGAQAHVMEERFETVAPLVRHHDAAAAVLMESLVSSRVAPLLRGTPRPVFAASSASVDRRLFSRSLARGTRNSLCGRSEDVCRSPR